MGKHLSVFIALLLLSLPLFSSAPVSETIGRVAVEIDDDSITAIALEAASKEYTESWLDEYAADKISFGEAYSPLLSSLLPLSGNIIAGEEKNNAVTIMDMEDGTVLTFIFRGGRIAAISQDP